LRLLLDEHYSPKIAEMLRDRGHDVVSVKERDDLRGLGDRELWSRASDEGRVLVTENVSDFMPLVHEAATAGEHHAGIAFTSPRSMPRGTETTGLFVERLEAFLVDRPRDDAPADQVHWVGSG
jgi:hypothetical protein